MPFARVHVTAHGRVQGVFYRDTMRRAAELRDVSGSAVNRADGTVECYFEGSRESVDAMIKVAREGSSASDVSMLEVEWIEPIGETGFATG